MAYAWPPMPELDPDRAAEILAGRLQELYDELEAERVRVLTDNYLRKPEVDAWIREFQAAITTFQADAAQNVARFIELHLAPRYQAAAEQAAQSMTGEAMSWTQAHVQALTSLATDTFEDFLARSLEAGRAAEAMVRAVREAAAHEIPKTAGGARTARQAGQALADRLRAERINHVVYRDGSHVEVSRYAEMAARTKSAVAYNAGTLNECVAAGVGYVEVYDGHQCGWTGHLDQDKANGTIRTVLDAAAHPIAHPQCRRAFGPRPDVTSDEEAETASLLSRVENRDSQQDIEEETDRTWETQPKRAKPSARETAREGKEEARVRRAFGDLDSLLAEVEQLLVDQGLLPAPEDDAGTSGAEDTT